MVKELETDNIEKYSLTFRKPNEDDIKEIAAFKQEFIENNSGMDGTGVLIKVSAEEWLKFNKEMETTTHPNYAKSLQYVLFNPENRLIGLIQIRLELKGYLIEFGGHIGYCVRPSERRKGYAKMMLNMALDICKEMGLDKVLITCLESNIASAKTIEACGGVFEKIVFDDKNYQANMKRYWIEL
ncbi:MAG: GNAT family N-acetyltransferase [Anaeroplasmataceae bacterium]|nr:GNAT family N-acetyltransferase [Anaeroplasmataceae bacterium]